MFRTFVLFWKGQLLSSACIDLQTDTKAGGNFLFIFLKYLLMLVFLGT